MNKGRIIEVNDTKYPSILATARYLRISPITIQRWIKKHKTNKPFKTGDLTIIIHDRD